jgi:hypothetical protein
MEGHRMPLFLEQIPLAIDPLQDDPVFAKDRVQIDRVRLRAETEDQKF